MITKKLFTTIAFAFVLLFSGCAKDDFVEIDGLCPVVVSTVPVDKATNVPLNQVITATFNEKMNPSTIPASFTVADNGTLIGGTVTYTDLTATFTPSSLLDYDTEYTGTIKTTAKDLRGNALQEDYVWTFTTAILVPTIQFTVALSANPALGGLTAGAGLFDEGSSVNVIATPNVGYAFVNWTAAGIEVSTDASYTFTLNADTTLVANFSPTFTLNVIAVNGTVAKNPDTATYNNGDNVILTPTAAPGYQFTSWSVDATGTNNPLTVLMDGNKNITANFTLITTGGICPAPAVDLGTSKDYAILAKSGISTTGTTHITGDMGISPAAATFIEGFGLSLTAGGAFSTSSLVTGNIYAPGYANPTPANLTTAVGDMENAFTTANGLAVDFTELYAGNLNGQTFAPGVYKWGTGVDVTDSIILDGGGVDCAAFVFQIAQDLTVANGTKIILINGAKADNIFWVVAGSKAALGTTVDFSGNILSKNLISLNTGAVVKGRLLAQTAVTLIANQVVKPN